MSNWEKEEVRGAADCCKAFVCLRREREGGRERERGRGREREGEGEKGKKYV